MSALTKSVLPGPGPGRVEQLEQVYADTLNVPHAIWLPSARYGICQAIDFGLGPQSQVYCPAFTCKVVHQAIRQSGRTMNLVDCSEDSLLMDTRFLRRPLLSDRQPHQTTSPGGSRNRPGYGVVLSEVFGYRYINPDSFPFLQNAELRIFDMAMCIPTVGDMQRLIDRDVALISFGLGKSLYAGWGGMAFTKDGRMADWLREQRHQDLRRNSTVAELLQIARVCLRTLAHASWLYKFTRRTVENRSSVSGNNNRLSAQPELLTPDWWQAPTAFHLKLANENRKRSVSFAQDRIEYNDIYRSELNHWTQDAAPGKQGWLTLPPANQHAMSHFCLRVHPSLRDSLRQHLWLRGIDTAVLFPFPEGADLNQLRNTNGLTRQIIGLPLSNGLGSHNIRRICSLVTDFLTTQQAAPNQPLASRSAA